MSRTQTQEKPFAGFQKGDFSDLTIPSSKEQIKTRRISVVDQAALHARSKKKDAKGDLQSIGIFSRELAKSDAARDKLRKVGRENPFPELRSVNVDDDRVLDYLLKQETFERNHPARKLRTQKSKVNRVIQQQSGKEMENKDIVQRLAEMGEDTEQNEMNGNESDDNSDDRTR
jgi:hypothetical protein